MGIPGKHTQQSVLIRSLNSSPAMLSSLRIISRCRILKYVKVGRVARILTLLQYVPCGWSCTQEWQKHPDVLYAHYLVQAGGKVTGGGDGMPTWVCELMVTKPDIDDAIDFVTKLVDNLEVNPSTPISLYGCWIHDMGS